MPVLGKDGSTPQGHHDTRKSSVSTEGEESVTETLAERRALHNSVERTRREALNSKFTHLAQQLPSLSHIHRPSKSVIISHCLDMVVDLKETKAENEALKQELFHMRLSLQGATQPPLRSQLRLAVPQDVLGSARAYDGLDSNASPRQLQRRHERAPLIPASPRAFRAPYPTALSTSYHHRPQMRSHSRHPIPGGGVVGGSNASMHMDKNGLIGASGINNASAFWQSHEALRLRLQPESYPLPDYAMVNEHFKMQADHHSGSGGGMHDTGDEGAYPIPAFFPNEYATSGGGNGNGTGGGGSGSSSGCGTGSYEVASQQQQQQQQQQQYLVKSEEAGLV